MSSLLLDSSEAEVKTSGFMGRSNDEGEGEKNNCPRVTGKDDDIEDAPE